MLALAVGRPDAAAKLFRRVPGPLAQALVVEIDEQCVRARDSAAERACTDLLRKISNSPTAREREEIIAGIRGRCDGDPKRISEARALLATFEKGWGDTKPAAELCRLARHALATCLPWPGEPWTVPGISLEMVPIRAGSFRMGSNSGRPAARPTHTVRISHDFWIGRTEVTQEQYEAITRRNPSRSTGKNLPVEQINWEDAMAFCRLVSERESHAGRLPRGYEYRLPSEAEWEYAAGGGKEERTTVYPGSDRVEEVAWFAETSGGKTHHVAQLKPNELGLYDMSGNVWEWCLDWCHSDYYSRSPETDPVCTERGATRSIRGAAWNSVIWAVPLTARDGQVPTVARDTTGLRLCLAPRMDDH